MFVRCGDVCPEARESQSLSSSAGVIQPCMFEPDTDCQKEEEELLIKGPLQVYASEWMVTFVPHPRKSSKLVLLIFSAEDLSDSL